MTGRTFPPGTGASRRAAGNNGRSDALARKFLYIVAVLVVLVIAGLIALRFWAEELTEFTFVPTAQFTPQPALAADVYENPAMWISRPGIGAKDPAHWLPAGVKRAEAPLGAAVFFIHPTSYLAKEHWNAPLDDAESRTRAELFVQGMASPFGDTPDLWAPRYRQAAFGAFLTDDPAAGQALDAAYGDVLRAFDYFVASIGKDRPIILAGHSQGAFHLRRLLRERVAGTPLARRIAAAYVIGWPVSLVHDLPAMGLPACTAPTQAGCVMSWQSFADPADPRMVVKGYERHRGLDGQPVGDSPFLCSNPLTGVAGGEAPASANLGTLKADEASAWTVLTPAFVPARCGPDGFLYIGAPPDVGSFVLPGNNYHVYDIPLFWANLRADAARRASAWQSAR